MKRLIFFLASFGAIGTLPLCPGTWGSAAGAFIAWQFNGWLPQILFTLCVIGFLISKPAAQLYQAPDPPSFVLDEVCGMMISVLWLPKSLFLVSLAFVLFRIFDIWKPWPIKLIQKSKNPLSIMWDDLAAGILANIILQLSMRFGILVGCLVT